MTIVVRPLVAEECHAPLLGDAGQTAQRYVEVRLRVNPETAQEGMDVTRFAEFLSITGRRPEFWHLDVFNPDTLAESQQGVRSEVGLSGDGLFSYVDEDCDARAQQQIYQFGTAAPLITHRENWLPLALPDTLRASTSQFPAITNAKRC